MLQELFRIPFLNIPVYGYGLMLVFSFLGAIELMRFLARRSGADPEFFANGAIIALVSGVAGARISHVIENIHEFTRPELSFAQNVFNMFKLQSGGLTYYGGLIGGFVCVLIYGIYKKQPIRKSMDIVAPAIVLGLGIGRIGCLLNGCCYGAQCDPRQIPWSIRFPYNSNAYVDQYIDGSLKDRPTGDLLKHEMGFVRPKKNDEIAGDSALKAMAAQLHSNPVHPAQIYSTITCLFICAMMVCYFTIPHAPGRGMAWMFMLEGPTRVLLELLRVEPPVVGVFSLSMIIGMVLATIGVVMWFVLGQMDRRPVAA